MAISKLILNGEVQMDVTSDTVAAGSLLSGKTATKNDGTKVTGTIASKSSSDLTVSGATVTAPAGYYANAASKAVTTTTHPNPTAAITSSTGVVTASHTQSTGYVTGGTTTGTLSLTTQAGKTVTPTESAQTAVASYRWTTGNVNVAAISSTYVGTGVAKKSSADLTASGSVVTVPAGYYSTAATKNVAAGSAFPPAVTITKAPTIGVNTSGVVTASYNGSSSITPTVTSGYVSQGTAGTISTTGTSTYQLTSKAAATYYPSTADQTIASQRWLTGAQTIKSVTTSNLTAANIVEGVVVKVGDSSNASRITQVTGTHTSNDFVITASKNNQGNLVIDKTYSEVMSAYNAGKNIVVKSEDYYGYDIYVDNDPIEPYFSIQTYDWISEPGFNPIIDITEWVFESDTPYVSGTYRVYDTQPANAVSGAVPADVANGKIFYNYNGYQVGTNPGKTYTVTLTNAGNMAAAYIRYKNVSYYSSGDTIDVAENDTIEILITRGESNRLYVNDQLVAGGTFAMVDYYYTVTSDVEISFSLGTGSSSGYITESDIEALTVTQNGTYTASGSTRGYSPVTVSVSGGSGGFTADEIAMQTISGSISGNATSIGSYAFYLCTSLTAASFPSCTYIGSYAFVSCNNLTTISFPSCTSIGNYAFGYCSKLTTVNFPSCIHIGNGALTSCYSLTAASFPLCTSIGASAFGHCYSLTTASFSLCTSIGASAFISCTSLTTVNFPSCTYIGTSAFRSCYNLLSVYLLGSSIPTLSTNAFSNTPITGRTTSTGGVYGSIFVPSSLYNSYLTATNWSALSDRIVSM